MIHLVFNRPTGKLKVFEPNGSLWDVIDAAGDAWGDGVAGHAPYGHDYPIPPGHYALQSPQSIAPPLVSEGAWQIPVTDISTATLANLVNAHRASEAGTQVLIAGIALPIGELGQHGRDGVMLHGGGSNLANLDPPQDPLAPFQQLCKTHGCTRLHNADLARLVAFLQPLMSGNTAVYTVVGEPLKLSL
jgi:hypothetical protein